MMFAHNGIRYRPIVKLTCSHITHTITVTQIGLKASDISNVYQVRNVKWVEDWGFLASILNAIYGAVCYQIVYYVFDDRENIVLHSIIIIKQRIWIISHFLDLGHETSVCAVCLSMLVLYYIMYSLIYNAFQFCPLTPFVLPQNMKWNSKRSF